MRLDKNSPNLMIKLGEFFRLIKIKCILELKILNSINIMIQ